MFSRKNDQNVRFHRKKKKVIIITITKTVAVVYRTARPGRVLYTVARGQCRVAHDTFRFFVFFFHRHYEYFRVRITQLTFITKRNYDSK